jgi:DNA-binding CsgD family transcriptional regulator
MLTPDGFASLALIYDAAVNPGRWRRALDAVSGVLDARAIALLIRRSDPTAKDRQMLNSTYLKFAKSPSGLYYNLRYSRLQDPDWKYLSRQPAHRPTLDTETGQSARDLDQRGDYAFLRRKLGLGRRLGVRLNSDRVWFDAMSIAFDARADQVPATAVEGTRLLLPHLTKAVELGRTFAQLKARYAAVLTALDRVRVGLAIALPSGEVIVSNAEADRVISLRDGLVRAPDGRLKCHDPDQSAQVASAIASAANTARGEEMASQCLMSVQRPSRASAILLDVAPLRDSLAELDRAMEGALITIIDPDRVPYLRIDRFVALYGLTAAEADVCRLILQGFNVDEIAEQRSTSPATAKNQVASVLAKTDVRRRAELIRLVVRVLPPVG